MTDSDLSPYLAAMGEFMRHTHDPEFRAFLKQRGWRPGEDVVIAFDDETIAALISRLTFNEASSPCLMAIPNADERFGFRLFFMQAVRPRRPRRRLRGRHQATPISPQATVGMLYSSLIECDAYVPSDWVEMTFTRVPEPEPV